MMGFHDLMSAREVERLVFYPTSACVTFLSATWGNLVSGHQTGVLIVLQQMWEIGLILLCTLTGK